MLVYLMVDVNAYTLLEVKQGLNMFCRKECPSREADWLDTWVLSKYLISMENSILGYITNTGSVDPCSKIGI